MIQGIANALSNSNFVNLTQSTAARVSIETTLKSIGRPGFILIDKDIDSNTKKYAATKELFYQLMCLAIYLAVIPTVFKTGSYKLGKKYFAKEHPEFNKFNGMSEYLDYHKFATKSMKDRVALLSKGKNNKKFTHDGLREELLSKKTPKQYALIKSILETGTYIGSILGLAVFAPQISHSLIHPVMKLFHLEKDEPKKTDIRA